MINGYYTTTDIIEQTKLSKSTIYNRIEKLNLPKRIYKVNNIIRIRYYTDNEVGLITNYKTRNEIEKYRIVYSNPIIFETEIIHSKLNFLTLNQLKKQKAKTVI